MTEVLSAIFGRKKAKGPAPSPPVVSTSRAEPASAEDFVMLPNSADLTTHVNSLYPNPKDTESGDYESLFSFLKMQPGENGNGLYRPARPAPPVPYVPTAGSPYSYGLTPNRGAAGGTTTSASESQTSGFYLSGIPFQISKSLGGGVSATQLKSDLSDVMSRLKAPNLAEYEYSFNLEEQVIREINT